MLVSVHISKYGGSEVSELTLVVSDGLHQRKLAQRYCRQPVARTMSNIFRRASFHESTAPGVRYSSPP